MKKLLIALVLFGTVLTSCTQNERAKEWGGTSEIQLKPNEKLINITWKDTDMWVLTKDTTTNISYFRESSSWGIWNGEIIIKP